MVPLFELLLCLYHYYYLYVRICPQYASNHHHSRPHRGVARPAITWPSQFRAVSLAQETVYTLRDTLSVITAIYLHLDESQTRRMSCGISISLARLAEGCAIWSISSEETTGPTHAENSQYSQSSSICAFQLVLKNSQPWAHGQRKFTWLDSHAACRFGSICIRAASSRCHTHPPAAELAMGLAASDVQFLWALQGVRRTGIRVPWCDHLKVLCDC